MKRMEKRRSRKRRKKRRRRNENRVWWKAKDDLRMGRKTDRLG